MTLSKAAELSVLLERATRWYAEMTRSADELFAAHPSLHDAAKGTREVAETLIALRAHIASEPSRLDEARREERERCAVAAIAVCEEIAMNRRDRADDELADEVECVGDQVASAIRAATIQPEGGANERAR